MTETIPGGCYLAADGKTYVNANGEPVSAENVAKFKELQKQHAERVAAQEAALAQQNITAAQVLTALVGMQPQPTLVVEEAATGAPATTDPAETTDAGKIDTKAKAK